MCCLTLELSLVGEGRLEVDGLGDLLVIPGALTRPGLGSLLIPAVALIPVQSSFKITDTERTSKALVVHSSAERCDLKPLVTFELLPALNCKYQKKFHLSLFLMLTLVKVQVGTLFFYFQLLWSET